ncbi:MAG: T9SS type A sorting domain-containing protein [Flavobacteriales bacterium]|nr:T9SS type A sorting domain-containing protein [Flavobacteriales bacterium]
MSRIRYTSSLLFISVAMLAGAQPITLVAPGNVPDTGGTFLVHRGDYVAIPSSGGGDQLFLFGAMTGSSTMTYRWENPALLPNGAQFPNADFALTNGGPDTVFYSEEAAGLERLGDTQTISALGTDYHFTSSYSNTVLELGLPLAYQGTWTDLFQGSFTVDGTSATRNGGINGNAIAWGRLQMPGGNDTLEVLRVTTRLTESIPLTISGFPITVSHVRNVDAFYTLWGKFPVYRTVSDSLTSQFLNQAYAYTEWLDATELGLADHAAGTAALQVFPNPATDRVSVVLPAAPARPEPVRVVDARGATVARTLATARTVELDVANLPAGLYQVMVGTNGPATRLLVSH